MAVSLEKQSRELARNQLKCALYSQRFHRFTVPSDCLFLWHYIFSTVERPYSSVSVWKRSSVYSGYKGFLLSPQWTALCRCCHNHSCLFSCTCSFFHKPLTQTADLRRNTTRGMCRNTEVLQLRKCSAKGKGCKCCKCSVHLKQF